MENYSLIELVKDGEIIARCYLGQTPEGLEILSDTEKGMHFNIKSTDKDLAKRLFDNAKERSKILRDLEEYNKK